MSSHCLNVSSLLKDQFPIYLLGADVGSRPRTRSQRPGAASSFEDCSGRAAAAGLPGPTKNLTPFNPASLQVTKQPGPWHKEWTGWVVYQLNRSMGLTRERRPGRGFNASPWLGRSIARDCPGREAAQGRKTVEAGPLRAEPLKTVLGQRANEDTAICEITLPRLFLRCDRCDPLTFQ